MFKLNLPAPLDCSKEVLSPKASELRGRTSSEREGSTVTLGLDCGGEGIPDLLPTF